MGVFLDVVFFRSYERLSAILIGINQVSLLCVFFGVVVVSMDKDAKDANGFSDQPLISADTQKNEDPVGNGEDYSELNSLLPPRTGGMSRNSDKVRRKVQWNDNNGNKLAEVLEFVPSDASDSDEEDSESCMCTIM